MRGVPATTWALRAVVALGPLVAILAPAPQGFTPSAFSIVVVLVASVAWALVPDNVLAGGALVLVLVWWTFVVGAALPFTSVVAAAALVLSHSAATVLGYGPPRAQLDRRLLSTWTLRAAAVWPAALVIWLVADVYSGRATPTSFWLLGLAAGLVGAVVAAVWVPLRSQGRL